MPCENPTRNILAQRLFEATVAGEEFRPGRTVKKVDMSFRRKPPML